MNSPSKCYRAHIIRLLLETLTKFDWVLVYSRSFFSRGSFFKTLFACKANFCQLSCSQRNALCSHARKETPILQLSKTITLYCLKGRPGKKTQQSLNILLLFKLSTDYIIFLYNMFTKHLYLNYVYRKFMANKCEVCKLMPSRV